MAEDAGLSIVIERHDDRTLLALRGELDLATAPLLANALNDANREVVVDLGDLAFVDASGLHVLARAGERMETHHNRLVVVNAGPMAQRIFELTGLDHLLSGSDAPWFCLVADLQTDLQVVADFRWPPTRSTSPGRTQRRGRTLRNEAARLVIRGEAHQG